MTDITPLNSTARQWSRPEIKALFEVPFNDLLFKAQTVHRENFDPNRVQVSTLLSIKTGACPEDCSYCPQSVRYDTGLEPEQLMAIETVVDRAKAAKASGATRFCMGAAYRSPKDKQLDVVIEMVREVKALGLETCATLGMLDRHQASQALKGAAAVVGLALIYRYWFSGALGEAGANVYMNSALFLSLGLIFLSDSLIDEAAFRVLMKTLGYLGLFGQAIAAAL